MNESQRVCIILILFKVVRRVVLLFYKYVFVIITNKNIFRMDINNINRIYVYLFPAS